MRIIDCQPMDFGRPEGSHFVSVSAILMQLFHRLPALQVSTVPLTRNKYKPWTFIFGNSADPLLALRRTLTGHSNGMKSCTLGTNEQRILLASRGFRVGPEFVLLRIRNWRLTLPNVPFITGYKEFCIGNPWGKGGLGGPNTVGRANWRFIVVTKDWFIGRKQHRTTNFGNHH